MTIPTDMLEVSFFTRHVIEKPEALIGKQSQRSIEAVERLKARINDLDKQITDATELIGTLPITELKKKLTALQSERQKTKTALDDQNREMLSAATAPSVLQDLKAIFKQYLNTEVPHEMDIVMNAVLDVFTQLEKQEVRKQLVGLVPNLVKGLKIDLKRSRYQVQLHNDEMTDWLVID
jgi:hypothetical protein